MSEKIITDPERCVGCGACVVACMEQNDICPEKGDPPFRRVSKIEIGEGSSAVIRYLSVGCNHCDAGPCLKACPAGAVRQDPKTGSVRVDRSLCTGCRSCAAACPFGVPRYDAENKMIKCDLCSVRVSRGLAPVCVKVCPMRALRFAEPDVTAD